MSDGQLTTDNRQQPSDDPPPILGTWPRLYTAVLLMLTLEVILFYIFTRTLA
jgi:hypothetical protein